MKCTIEIGCHRPGVFPGARFAASVVTDDGDRWACFPETFSGAFRTRRQAVALARRLIKIKGWSEAGPVHYEAID